MSEQKHSSRENFGTQLEILKRYCAFQERSVKDVQQKAGKIHLNPSDTDQAVRILQEEGFLDEHRYAYAFVNGKLKYNQWGKIKIRYELQLRKIDKAFIGEALNSIDETVYEQTLKELVQKKAVVLQRNQQKDLYRKLMQYAMSKGFESDLIRKVLTENKYA